MKKRIVLLLVLVFCAAFASAQKLVIVAEDFPPFEFVEGGVVKGLDIDIAKAVFKKLNVEADFQILPWARAWNMVETGDADGSLTTSRKAEREPFVIYPKEDMWTSEFVFFVRNAKKTAAFSGYEDAKRNRLKVGIIRGNSYDDSFWQAFPYQDAAKKVLNAQLDEAVDIETNFRKLAGGRIDLFIADKTVGLYKIKQLGLQNDISFYDKALFSKGYPIVFAKNSKNPKIKEIAAAFEKELAAMKASGEYKKIYDSWVR